MGANQTETTCTEGRDWARVVVANNDDAETAAWERYDQAAEKLEKTCDLAADDSKASLTMLAASMRWFKKAVECRDSAFLWKGDRWRDGKLCDQEMDCQDVDEEREWFETAARKTLAGNRDPPHPFGWNHECEQWSPPEGRGGAQDAKRRKKEPT